MMNRTFLITPLFIFTLLASQAAQADDADLKRAVESMLDAGWPGSFKTRAAADDEFKNVQSVSRGDKRAVYAYILVLMKQRRYPEAESLLEKLVAHDEEDVHAWKAKAWLSMLLKKHERSLADLDKISLLLEADAAKDKEQESVEFMGRMIGYLEGPAQGAVTKSRLDRQTVRIDARLDDSQAEAFESARQSVVDMFNDFSKEKVDSKQKAEVEAVQQQEKLKEDLDEESQRLDSRREAIAPEVEKIRDEGKEELKAIADEDAPLLKELDRLDAQAFELRREESRVASSLVALQSQAGQTRDASLQGALNVRVNDLAILSSRYRSQMNLLERRASQIIAQREQIARRYNETQQRYKKRLAKLGVEMKNIEKLEKRNAYQAKRATKPGAGDLRRTRSLDKKAKALNTYEDFSLEAEKQRVLDLF